MVNYGIGGHYEPHYDHSTEEEASFTGPDGNRIATVLFYVRESLDFDLRLICLDFLISSSLSPSLPLPLCLSLSLSPLTVVTIYSYNVVMSCGYYNLLIETYVTEAIQSAR